MGLPTVLEYLYVSFTNFLVDAYNLGFSQHLPPGSIGLSPTRIDLGDQENISISAVYTVRSSDAETSSIPDLIPISVRSPWNKFSLRSDLLTEISFSPE